MAEQTEISIEDFRVLAERSGMKLSADELAALKPMYDHFAKQIAPIHDLEPTPGSFGTYLGIDQKIPVITLELTSNESIRRPEEGYRRALLAAVHFPGSVPSRVAK